MWISTHLGFITFILALNLTFIKCQFHLKPKTEAAFAAEVISELYNQKSAEQLISPASLYRTLAIIRIASSQPTSQPLKRLFQGPNVNISSEIGPALKNLISIQKSLSIFYTRRGKVHHLWRQRILDDFDFVQSNFKRLSATDINKWIKRKTNKKIQGFIKPDRIHKGTTQVVVDILSFRAKWRIPFNEVETYNFHKFDGIYDVEMYQVHGRFLYGNFVVNGVKAATIVLPFADNQTQMLIILPKDRKRLNGLMKSLRQVDITKIPAKLKPFNVRVYMPKLKIQNNEPLQPVLEAIVDDDLFSSEAQFERLAWGDEIELRAKYFQHEVALDSTMYGLSAIAVTSVQWEFKDKAHIDFHDDCQPDEKNLNAPLTADVKTAVIPDRYMDIDHPFFYAILAGKNILFAGGITNV